MALALLGLVLPASLEAWFFGSDKVLRMPEAVRPENSQTMSLLEAYLNTNPTGTGGAEISIVDETALSTEVQSGESTFVDAGQAGTGQISVYIVRKGDTLASIAKMFGVSTNTVTWANDLKGGKIVEGQELVILPISGVRHTARSGDTLRSIAQKYKADLDEILAYNDLTSTSKLAIGDVVLVPNGEIRASETPVSPRIQSASSLGVDSTGYFIRPIVGGRKSQGRHGHNGVDLAASLGTAIRAAANGRVIIARVGGYNGGYGTYVAVSHPNGTQTLYAHMSRVDVSVGEEVEQGDLIGAVGNTGRSSGPHLHFEVRGAKNPF